MAKRHEEGTKDSKVWQMPQLIPVSQVSESLVGLAPMVGSPGTSP